jgi:hypothetical protein
MHKDKVLHGMDSKANFGQCGTVYYRGIKEYEPKS